MRAETEGAFCFWQISDAAALECVWQRSRGRGSGSGRLVVVVVVVVVMVVKSKR